MTSNLKVEDVIEREQKIFSHTTRELKKHHLRTQDNREDLVEDEKNYLLKTI